MAKCEKVHIAVNTAFRWRDRHRRGLTVNCPPAKIMEIRYNYQCLKFGAAGSFSAMTQKFSLQQLNSMPVSDFVAALGDVFEHAPWVAGRRPPAVPTRPSRPCIRPCCRPSPTKPRPKHNSPLSARIPNWARRFARADITADSQAEQGGLGLDRLSDEEFARFSALNARYRDKFGIPFIVCVRRHTRDSILAQFERRLKNDAGTERTAALREIGFITRLRLAAKIGGPCMPKTEGRLIDPCA